MDGEIVRLPAEPSSADSVIFRSRLHAQPCDPGVVQAAIERWQFSTRVHNAANFQKPPSRNGTIQRSMPLRVRTNVVGLGLPLDFLSQ